MKERVFVSIEATRHMPLTAGRGRFLLSGNGTNSSSGEEEALPDGVPLTHLKPRFKLRMLVDSGHYSFYNSPVAFSLIDDRKRYLPILYNDELHLPLSHLVPVSRNLSQPNPNVTLQFIPTSIGTYRLLKSLELSVESMLQMGLTHKETDQLLSPDHLVQLSLTYLVAFLHLIFAFLAFKNDVGFWRQRRDIAGLSRRAVIGRAISGVIVFLFLYDSPGTSWLVLATNGVSALIDIWKVSKVLKFSIFSPFSRAEKSKQEAETDELDAAGMYYLSLVLYPLVGGWAIYSLYYRAHRSWWSWFISSAANGVYAFGFLLMTPQIFINWKLKSVAHLPWRAMTYKVFNTFIDDVFAFIIDMPTIHRLATLRDDVVFFIYLYQRWIYPVDMSRVNEFGSSFDDKKDADSKSPTANREESSSPT